MYLSDRCLFLLCTCGRDRGGRRGGLEKGEAGERGRESILYGVQLKFQLYP
jgi:hypothetical protein